MINILFFLASSYMINFSLFFSDVKKKGRKMENCARTLTKKNRFKRKILIIKLIIVGGL